MSSFQRLIAIPEEQYVTMMNVQKQQGPLAQHMQSLEYRLKEEENPKDPYRQLVMQSDVFGKMLNLKEQMRDSISISTPKPYVNRAQALFRNIEAFVKFNDKGEIITNGDRVIPHSRIEDLIQHAVRDRRRNIMPVGWEYFIRLLQEYNVPKSLLNRATLDELEGATASVETRNIKLEPDSGEAINIKLEPAERITKQMPTSSKRKVVKRKVTTLYFPKRSQPSRKVKSNVDFLAKY